MLVVTVVGPTIVALSAGAVMHSVMEYAPETGELVVQLLDWATVTLLCEAANIKKQLIITSLRIRRNSINLKKDSPHADLH